MVRESEAERKLICRILQLTAKGLNSGLAGYFAIKKDICWIIMVLVLIGIIFHMLTQVNSYIFRK